MALSEPQLAELMGKPGPFVTVYLTADAEIENASHHSERRWKTVRADLAEQGAPLTTLGAIDPLVPGAHHFGQCLTVIAASDGSLHVEHQLDPPKSDVGRWAALPAVGPLIEWHQQSVPHVVVLADRRGADLIAMRREGPDFIREAGGHDDPITRSAPGGWSQRRYQQRAENTWEENAREVSDELERVVEQIEARLVVLAGDVRAVQLLREHLRPDVDQLVHVVPGGRSPDGSSDAIAAEATRLVATVVAAETRAFLQHFREESGQADRAADGPAATLAALNEGRVEVLLVPGDLDDAGTAWFGPEPIPVAESARSLRDLGVAEPQEASLVDVLVRAAVGTSAGVRIIPRSAAPQEGIGAILRW